MKICRNCGKENKDNAVFCGYCGKTFEDIEVPVAETKPEPKLNSESFSKHEPKLRSESFSTHEPKMSAEAIADIEPVNRKKRYLIIIIAVIVICVAAAGVFALINKGNEEKKDLPEFFEPIQLLNQAYADDSSDLPEEIANSDYMQNVNEDKDMSKCTYMEDTLIKSEVVSADNVSEAAEEVSYDGDPNEKYEEYYTVTTHCNQTIDGENSGSFIEYLVGKSEDGWEILGAQPVTVELSEVGQDWSQDTEKLLTACDEIDMKSFYKQTLAEEVVTYNLVSPFINDDIESEVLSYLEGMNEINEDRLVYAQRLTDEELEEYKAEVRTIVDQGIENYDLGDNLSGIISGSISKVLDKSTEGMRLAFDNDESDTIPYDYEILMLKVGDDWELGWIY